MEMLCALSAAWEKGVSSELPYWARGASHSQLSFSPRRGCCRRVFTLLPWCRGGTGRVSLPLSVPLKLVFLLVFFFSHMVFWNLPSGRLDFHNYSLVCGYLPSAALSRFSPTTADRIGPGCWFCRPYQGLSFCCQMHKCARLFPGRLPSLAAGSHKIHRDTFVDGCLTGC